MRALSRHFATAFAATVLLAGAPVRAENVDNITSAVVFWDFANCALDRDKWRAEQMLSAPRDSDARKQATRDLALKNKDCLNGGGKPTLTPGIMRDTIAGAYVARYYKHVSAFDLADLPEIYTEQRLNGTTEPKARLAIGLRRFAECVSRKDFPLVAALLSTKPFSEGEAALFGQLGDTMNSCIPVEQGTKVVFDRLDLRARLGTVAFELVAAAKLEPSNNA